MQNKGKDEKKGQSAGSSPPSASPHMRAPPASSLRQAAAVRAQSVISQHFGGSAIAEGLETQGVKLLKEICSNLGQPGAIELLFDALRDKGGAEVSTFEFLSSGANEKLRAYLLGKPSAGSQPRQSLAGCWLSAPQIASFCSCVFCAGHCIDRLFAFSGTQQDSRVGCSLCSTMRVFHCVQSCSTGRKTGNPTVQERISAVKTNPQSCSSACKTFQAR